MGNAEVQIGLFGDSTRHRGPGVPEPAVRAPRFIPIQSITDYMDQTVLHRRWPTDAAGPRSKGKSRLGRRHHSGRLRMGSGQLCLSHFDAAPYASHEEREHGRRAQLNAVPRNAVCSDTRCLSAPNRTPTRCVGVDNRHARPTQVVRTILMMPVGWYELAGELDGSRTRLSQT